tara:strand:- start:1539 stop:2651 length:1113 start_codon:yes stop_codon:yes gene_type:complete
MRVLILNYEFPPLGGGGANATKYILKEFKKFKDLKIDLVTSSEKNKNEVIKFGENINIYKLNVRKKHVHHWRDIEVLRYMYKGLKLCKKLNKSRRYDLCHAFFTLPCGYIPFKLKIPYITSIRGSDVPGFNERFKLHYKLIKSLTKKIWKNSKFVISNSEGLKSLALKTKKNQKIEIIYNGVDTGEFTPKIKRNKNLEIICVARLIQRKGISYLISAISKLKKKNIRLTIIGSGIEKENLGFQIKKLHLEEKVRLLNEIPHEKLPEYYSNSDLFVLPSLNEGMSNTILEAIASGLPIITTDTGGSTELIKGNGIIVNKKNSEEIKEAILKLYNDKDLIKEMSKKSRKRAEELDWKKVAKNYYNYYKKCAE